MYRNFCDLVSYLRFYKVFILFLLVFNLELTMIQDNWAMLENANTIGLSIIKLEFWNKLAKAYFKISLKTRICYYLLTLKFGDW